MARNILPEPPDDLKRLSRALVERIYLAIDETGTLPFSQYMEMALYEPGLGYYSAGLHKLGASGDFVTAPEIGRIFSACVAQQAKEVGEEIGEYDVLEVGAGTGAFAAGFLGRLTVGNGPRRYRILERSADLRQVQRDRLASEVPQWLDRIEWLDRPPSESWQGLLIANEVIDALSAECFAMQDGKVLQCGVSKSKDGFEWNVSEPSGELESAVRHIEATTGRTFEDGYRSEVRLHLAEWLDSLTRSMSRGLALFVDYGYERTDYYRPDRNAGTLMCHYRHRAHDDPFFWPGLQDITAWVDFTAMAEAADRCGLDVAGYASQAFFLVGCGMESVLQELMADSEDQGIALAAEARQLTLPGMMGEKFKVMGLARGLQLEPRGFSLEDLTHRL